MDWISMDRKELEKKLLDVARNVMHKDAIDAQRSLFEQGLTSVGALDIRSNIESSFGLVLVSNLVFDYPTISGLAQFLAEHAGMESAQARSKPSASGPGPGTDAISEADIREILKQKFGV